MKQEKIYRLDTETWYIERAVYLLAGIFVLASIILSLTVHKNFLYFTALVGAMLINFSLTGYCPLSILLGKTGLKKK
ncbi:MAG: hypothetical protein UW95_C0003G0062 [Parcubacteria group bacterium GW2011_GWC1_45_14]|nr:MAG: hypothetical protein UW87_C0002G0051 [Candidatus Moranbacteria bacterium GW2011_GWC2_45_10]KKT95220.1 MAG: hypothetical protein UW95_C0003G0062 [Parcubacteria group bacterium GW2011_GWC1_45_14]